jgi:hypothetical protein
MVCHACSGLLRADDGALCSECRERLRAARADEWRVWLAELRGVDVSRVTSELVDYCGLPHIRLFIDGVSQGLWNLS